MWIKKCDIEDGLGNYIRKLLPFFKNLGDSLSFLLQPNLVINDFEKYEIIFLRRHWFFNL